MDMEYNVTENLKITKFHSIFEGFFDTSYVFPGETHNFWEFVYVVDGKIGVTADKDFYVLTSGDVIFHKPFELHNIRNNGNTSARVFVFTFDMHGPLEPEFYNMTLKLDQKTNEIFKEIIFELRKRDRGKLVGGIWKEYTDNWNDFPVENQIISLKITIFFLKLLLAKNIPKLPQQNLTKNEKIHQSAIRYMVDNISSTITTEEIANMLYVSPTTLKNVFRKYSGMGVHQYYLSLKISRATELLNDGYTVSETSELLGFKNVSYFSSVYKRETGISPSKIVKLY